MNEDGQAEQGLQSFQSNIKSRRLSTDVYIKSSTEQKRRLSAEDPAHTTEDVSQSSLPNIPTNNLIEYISEVDRHMIKASFEMIESLWRDISMGSESVASSILGSIHKNLGEFGSELFKKYFMIGTKQELCLISNCLDRYLICIHLQICKVQFWFQWMKFLSEETFSQIQNTDFLENSSLQRRGSLSSESSLAALSESTSIFEKLHSKFSPSRRLKHRFFEAQILVKKSIVLVNSSNFTCF